MIMKMSMKFCSHNQARAQCSEWTNQAEERKENSANVLCNNSVVQYLLSATENFTVLYYFSLSLLTLAMILFLY